MKRELEPAQAFIAPARIPACQRPTRHRLKSRRKKNRLSPGRKQYLEFKQQYSDALLLFRMGDFYETFDEDAETMAEILDIALTSRDVGGGVKAALAGIPHHALNGYLPRLVKSGLKIAIAEQVSDPATTKGIVDRAVVRVVTPGTVQEPDLLSAGSQQLPGCSGPAMGRQRVSRTLTFRPASS